MEHLQHFRLTDDPFRNEPLLRLFFENGPQQDALRRLERSVRQSRGLSLLIGAAGAGKTMVVRRLLDNLEEEIFEASMMVVLHGAADTGWMLRRFAVQLGVEEPATEREGLIAQIYEQLAIVREDGRHAVLIIDDAEALAQPRALAEICGLLKLEYEDRRLLSLVLAGSSLLDEAFCADPMLAHRIDVKVHLDPFSREAAAAYLDHRIRLVGGDPNVLDDSAVAALHELGSGYPGRINTLADNALFEAFLCGRDRMSRLDVDRAHRDLGWNSQPPVPADTATKSAAPITTEPISDSPVVTGEITNPDADPDGIQETLDELDSELAAVFKAAHAAPDVPPAAPDLGPPKHEDPEPEDLLVELVED